MRLSPPFLCGCGLLVLALLLNERSAIDNESAPELALRKSVETSGSALERIDGSKPQQRLRKEIDPLSLLPELAEASNKSEGARPDELELNRLLASLSAAQLRDLIALVSGDDDGALPEAFRNIDYGEGMRIVGEFQIPECLGGPPAKVKPKASKRACVTLIRQLAAKDPSGALAALEQMSELFGPATEGDIGITTIGSTSEPCSSKLKLEWMLTRSDWIPAIQAAAAASPETTVDWLLGQQDLMR